MTAIATKSYLCNTSTWYRLQQVQILPIPEQEDLRVVQNEGAVGLQLLAAVLVDVESLVGEAALGPADGVGDVFVDDAVERRLEGRHVAGVGRRQQQVERQNERESKSSTLSSIHHIFFFFFLQPKKAH